MRNWLIRKLGGIPWEQSVVPLNLCDRKGSVIINGYSEDIIQHLGGVPLPKAEEGQYLRRPAACKMPVRKVKGHENLDTALKQTELPKPLNLCDDCGATAEACINSNNPDDPAHCDRRINEQGDTTQCSAWRPGVQGAKVDRAGTDSPSPSTEPGTSSLLGPSKGAGQ